MSAPARAMPAGYRLGVLLLLSATSGCLTPEKPPVASADLKTMQCQTQRITGSLVATRVCTLQFQREKIHQARIKRELLGGVVVILVGS